MNEPNYTSKPYAMGDRPVELLQTGVHNHAKETEASPGLPLAIMEDFGDTPGGQLARAARMQRNVAASMQESKVAKNTFQIIGAAMVGGVVGAAVGLAADLLIHQLHLPKKIEEAASHTMVTAGMIAGIHAGEKILAPKHVNTISDKTQKLIEQSDSQTARAYAEVLALEKSTTETVPLNNISEGRKGERLQEPQMQLSVVH